MDNFMSWLLSLACFALVFGIISSTRKLGKRTVLAFLISGLLLAFSPIFYEFPPLEGRVMSVAKDGSQGAFHPLGTFEWVGYGIFNVPTQISVMSSVTPITENPKARHIR